MRRAIRYHVGTSGKPLLTLAALVILPVLARAQQGTVPGQITEAIDENNRTVLRGNTHPLARAEFDRGAAPADLSLQRMLLVLRRSPAQEAALESLLEQQQNPSLPNYHRWLTPQEFGQQFGPADQDVAKVTAWLQAHGLQVDRIAKGRVAIEFSGTAAALKEAFHTEMHKYVVNGEDHWANASDPEIPTSLAPAIAGVASLHNFRKRPMYRLAGNTATSVNRRTQGDANTELTLDPCLFGYNELLRTAIPCYLVGPYDFATIYNVLPLWNSNPPTDGTGVTIAIVGRTNINLQDAIDFRNYFGLPANPPQIILDGQDPGLVPGDELEADLDVEWSGGVAKGATVKLVVSESTETTDGIDLSALYVVDDNLADVVSTSYGECELFFGAGENQYYSNVWQQAAAQGITAFVSSGDSGSAGCDNPEPLSVAEYGLAVSGLASTPYNVAVGGTDFSQVFNLTTYWNTTSASTTQESAKGYIPETTWNLSCTNSILIDPRVGYGTNSEMLCNNNNYDNFQITLGGSGGASNCTAPTGTTPASCAGGYPKPIWQTGPGVPNDRKRDLPDVSLFASSGFQGSATAICAGDAGQGCGTGNVLGIGGTSVSSPAFAGIMALVVQKTGSRQGNANYVFYKLAAQQSAANCNSSTGPAPTCAFNDITDGTIAMPCATGSANCVTANAGDAIGILSGYAAGAGYDQATGLGSVNAFNMVENWSALGNTASASTLALNGGNPVNITHGTPVSVSVSVSPATPQPTGNIQLMALSGGNPSLVGTYPLSGGTAAGTTNLLPAGASYSVHAHYVGDPTYAPSDSNGVTVTVNAEASTTSVRVVTYDPATGIVLNANATSVPYGSIALLRADITNSSGTNCFNRVAGAIAYACPTGTVTLAADGVTLGSGGFALNSQGFTEDQSFQVPSGGAYNYSANYSGDNNYAASSGTDSVTVTPAPMIGGTGGASPIPVVIGAKFTIDAAVRTVNPGSYATPPGGTFAMFEGNAAVPITQYSLTGVIYPFPDAPYVFETIDGILSSTPAGPPGLHAFTTQYSGDANYQPFTSPPFSLEEVYATKLMLGSSAPSIPYGQSVSLTAQVVPSQMAGAAPTGSVLFSANGSTLGTGTVTAGQAQISTASLSGGNQLITASYSGDSNYASSTGSFTQTVSPLATTLALTAPTPFVGLGAPIVLTAQVTPAQVGPSPLTGNVTFTANGHTLGTPTISGNQAQWNLSFNSLGPVQVQATYSGDGNYASSSTTLTETVATLTIAAASTTIVVPGPGQSGSITLTFSEQGGLAGSTTLSPAGCLNLPPASTCSFSPPMLSFSASQTTMSVMMTVTTTAAGSLAAGARKFSPLVHMWTAGIAFVWACAFCILLFIANRKRRWAAVLALAGLIIAASAAGCGGGGGGGGGGVQGTPPGIYPNESFSLNFNGVYQSLYNITVQVQ